MRAHAHGELQAWLDGTLYPALFRNLPSAFPEFGWRRFARGWQATRWPVNFPEAVDHPNPERLQVYADGPAYIKIHGRGAVRFLHIAAGESSPRGERFLRAVRDLAERAGVDVAFLERELSPEEQVQVHARELRRSALALVLEACHERLLSDAGGAAREYLAGRGLREEDLRDFRLGLYHLPELQALLARAGLPVETRGSVLRESLEGYLTFPWADAYGYPLTLYGRWPGSPPEGRPKTMALPGEGTKGAPLYLDRALRAGHREVVAVEGLLDALLLQARGETRAVAYVAAQFSTTQIETLVRHRVERVILCGDPDGGGDKGTDNNVDHLEAAGIATLVTDRLPDGLDPDELLLRDGIDAWRDRVLGATPGRVWQAERVIGELSPTSPESLRRKALDGLKAIYRHEGREAALDRERILALASKRLGYPRSLVRKMLAGDEPKDAASAPAPEVLQPQEGWRRELIRDHAGQIVPSLANTALILRNAPGIAGAIAYNELRRDVELRTAPPWRSEGGTWTDVDDAQAAIWLHQTHRLHVRSDTVREASLVVAREQSYDPLKLYLQSLRWDGTPRIDLWLTAYLGVQDTPLARGIGAAWLRSAVGRALVPGLEVHAALILEGLQGRGKSSAFRILAGEFFCDETLDLHSKDAILIVSRSWIVEMAELSSLTRSEVEQTKSFLSRMVDRFRPPFGRRVIEVPRRCVFGGSTNASDYLVDATGNRRFWPVRVGSIDLDALARDRDQLWAEAVASFLDGATHNLAPQLWGAATEAAEARYQADAWEERIAPYLKAHESAPLGVSQGEILEEAIGLPRERWGQVEQRRVAKILQRLGWEKFRAPPDADGYRPWRYRYPGRYSDGV